MAPDVRALSLARDWMAAADRQLDLARAASERRMANETVSLAAAAAERYLKATLAYANRSFEYTHNIDRLIGKVEENVREAVEKALTARVRQQLTDGGTVARYPGGPSYSTDEAAVALAAVEAARVALLAIRPDLFADSPDVR
jgi:HEPN domain-containing protein